MACCVHIWGQHVVLLLHDDAAGYVLLVASLACCVHIYGCSVLLLPGEQHVLLLLHDDVAGYVLLVAVHAYTHASSCVLSP